jgi:hypothetical protein
MDLKRICFSLVLMTMLATGIPLNHALAGMDTPPAGSTYVGPEVWAVVTIDCSLAGDKLALVRAKKVVDCNVETEALKFFVPNCPAVEGDILDFYLPGYTLFGQANPVVTKIKNFKVDVKAATADEPARDLRSFDALIKYVE